jgi:hypothetical protein
MEPNECSICGGLTPYHDEQCPRFGEPPPEYISLATAERVVYAVLNGLENYYADSEDIDALIPEVRRLVNGGE